jgi:hypothetical protein
MLPFWLMAPAQWSSFLVYHRERGFEIGSTVGALSWLGRSLGLTAASSVFNYGAVHVESPLAGALLPWTIPLLVFAVGGALVLYLERFVKERENNGKVNLRTLVTGTVVVLLAFIVVNKVFSPQYIVWLIPFVALLEWRAIAMFACIMALTVYVYPFHWEEVQEGQLIVVLALNCRNMLVIGLVLLLWFSRRPGPPEAGP